LANLVGIALATAGSSGTSATLGFRKVGVHQLDPTETGVRSPSVATLRGAAVDVDVRRVGRIVVALCLSALALGAALLFAAGAHHNAQLARLDHDGVPVTITVTGCLGLLGGSGSNAAGYTCRGTFVLEGHRYREVIPGDGFHPQGTKLRALSVPGDPALLSTPGAAPAHPSAGVYLVPSLLVAVLLVALSATVVIRRRRTRRASAPRPVGLTERVSRFAG
jgi:hypothetical protein